MEYSKIADRILNNNEALNKQILDVQEIISKFKTNKSSNLASSILLDHL